MERKIGEYADGTGIYLEVNLKDLIDSFANSGSEK